MRRMPLAALSCLLLAAVQVQGQAVSFDPYFALPGPRQELGLALLPATTPDITEVGSLSTTELAAKYSLDGRLDFGARAELGLLHDGADGFSSFTLGGRYAWTPDYAVTLNLTPYNEAEELGLSVGALGTHAFPEFRLDGQLHLGLLDAYAPVGTAVHLLLRPSRQLDRRITGYLDLDLKTNTDDLGEHLSVLAGPNVAVRLDHGWQVNGGVFFSVLSGDFAADTELGLRLAVQRFLAVR